MNSLWSSCLMARVGDGWDLEHAKASLASVHHTQRARNSHAQPLMKPQVFFNTAYHPSSIAPRSEWSQRWSSTGLLRQRVTIGTLPDDTLLEIFSFYVDGSGLDAWFTLVHVCRSWRYVVFASPRRLQLQLFCTAKRPVREMLDIWPSFPITIERCDSSTSLVEGADNIIAALEHNERVREIFLKDIPSSTLESFAAAMQEPFPELTDLELRSNDEAVWVVLPEAFLGGCAPCLRSCKLDNLPFLALRNLLWSARHLVDLCLRNIPHSAYIPPEAMVTCLSMVPSLETLVLVFRSPRSRPDRASRRPPPLTRTVLPALTDLHFRGVSEYLEDLISQIDVPLLNDVHITLFHQLIFDVSQLHQFISRTEKLRELNAANAYFHNGSVFFGLSPQVETFNRPRLGLSILCSKSDWQLSSLAQVCGSSLPPLSTVQHLDIVEGRQRPDWEDAENTQWLELFRSFTAVKDLYLSDKLALRVAPALRELPSERAIDVLPTLRNLYLASLPSRSEFGQFVAARELSDHSVTVKPRWERSTEGQ
ncbi:hypothetical protein BJV74DRAFT_990500 [Russula compacta]|nr:hypothetical protein BJV74DRAFT_990500 [Russula compacta]